MRHESEKQDMHRNSQQKSGFSLVELVIAVAIFSVVMLLVTGIVVNGLQVRKKNKVVADAQTYVFTVLEQFKSDWSDRDNYEAFDGVTLPGSVTTLLQNGVPENFNAMELNFECVNLDGSSHDCSDTPPLRRISLTLTDKSGKAAVDLITEIGDPSPKVIN